MSSTERSEFSWKQRIGLIAGPAAALALFLAPPPDNLSVEGWWTLAIAVWMSVWWISEAIPLAATGLLPIITFPLLGIGTFESNAQLYAHPLIFLFLGGFLMARAVNIWGLDQRLAARVIRLVGTSPKMIVAAMMMVTAFLSMWVSNTATAMVMLPIGLSIAAAFGRKDTEYSKELIPALLLGIAYAATIGGIGTIIGTPPNALFVAFMQTNFGVEISFLSWMKIGVPVLLILLPLAWLILTKIVFDVGNHLPADVETVIKKQLSSIPPLSWPESVVAGILCIVAMSWMLRPVINTTLPWLPLTDAGIAMCGALLMFILPTDLKTGRFILNWQQASEIRWDVLILFGGGLSLAAAIGNTDLALWTGNLFGDLAILPFALFLLLLGVIIVIIGELASNTAMAAVFLPIAGAVALNIDKQPVSLMLPVALFATLGFMLPVATPPNAIVFGSGAFELRDMLKAGILIDVVGILVVTLTLLLFGSEFLITG